MAEEPQSNEWDTAPEGAPNPVARAAVFTWILGAVSVLVFGCCTGTYLVASILPTEQLREFFKDVTQEELALAQRGMMVRGVISLALGLAPGIAYLVLGFGVR